MQKSIWPQTPIYFFAILFLTIFFLSCTKKPSTTTAAMGTGSTRTPAATVKGMYTTARGYKVQLEPVQFGNAQPPAKTPAQ